MQDCYRHTTTVKAKCITDLDNHVILALFSNHSAKPACHLRLDQTWQRFYYRKILPLQDHQNSIVRNVAGYVSALLFR